MNYGIEKSRENAKENELSQSIVVEIDRFRTATLISGYLFKKSLVKGSADTRGTRIFQRQESSFSRRDRSRLFKDAIIHTHPENRVDFNST